ncbi:MAG TPA: hydrolase [Clostridiales bacterium]|nr:hydrolase [Clostridiales bacterium]
MRILLNETMALVIDFQERLLPAMFNQEELIKNTKNLIKGFNVLDVPTIVTQQYTRGLGMTVNELQEEFNGEFTYYDKVEFSCYDNEEIKRQIKKMNKKNIIICGIESHICVQQTVIDLLANDYNVILIKDCIGSRKTEDTITAIQRMISEGVTITSYESVLFELTRKAGTETFKSISKIIK